MPELECKPIPSLSSSLSLSLSSMIMPELECKPIPSLSSSLSLSLSSMIMPELECKPTREPKPHIATRPLRSFVKVYSACIIKFYEEGLWFWDALRITRRGYHRLSYLVWL